MRASRGRLDGAIALISGGARGQGASHVRGLLSEGAQVVFGDVLEAAGRALEAELGDGCAFIPLDVTQQSAWERAVEFAETRFGPVSVLINNAGVPSWTTVADTDPSDFQRVVDVNLVGCFKGMHATIPSLRRAGGGTIVNISSAVGMIGFASSAAYVASKWGIRGLTKAAALELGRQDIRVLSVHPGPIDTPMIEGFDEQAYSTQALQRIGKPEEVTAMIVFLIAEATYSTGSEFVIDGGMTLGAVHNPIESTVG